MNQSTQLVQTQWASGVEPLHMAGLKHGMKPFVWHCHDGTVPMALAHGTRCQVQLGHMQTSNTPDFPIMHDAWQCHTWSISTSWHRTHCHHTSLWDITQGLFSPVGYVMQCSCTPLLFQQTRTAVSALREPHFTQVANQWLLLALSPYMQQPTATGSTTTQLQKAVTVTW